MARFGEILSVQGKAIRSPSGASGSMQSRVEPSCDQTIPETTPGSVIRDSRPNARARKVGPSAVALVIGLAALTAQAGESDLVRDIQRYCTVCWRNARLDPRLWDDCTQEVCCRLLTKARDGQLDLTLVLAEDTPERRELVRAIDMVRKRVQRARKHQSLDPWNSPPTAAEARRQNQLELGEILEAARRAVLTPRQDRIVELWMRGWSVPEIGGELNLPIARVSDEKYKALRKLENHLRSRRDELGLSLADQAVLPSPNQAG
jgi:DNA-directed RNA polymerase specialized sigma24 family protein